MPPLPYPSWVYFAFFFNLFFRMVLFCFVCLSVCLFLHWLQAWLLFSKWRTHFLGTPTDFRHAFLHTCLMYWLSFKTDHDRFLTTLANLVVSKETLCDIWLTINLRGKKNRCAYLHCQATRMKKITSQPATLIELKSHAGKVKSHFFFISN